MGGKRLKPQEGLRIERRGKAGKHIRVWITHEGETLTDVDWGRRLGTNRDVILMRLRNGFSIAETLSARRYQREVPVLVEPVILPPGYTPESAAAEKLISADQYLDFFGEPRRKWQDEETL